MPTQPLIQYSNQQLIRQPTSILDRLQLKLERRAAQQQFQRQDPITWQSLEIVLPGLSKTRATIQNAVPTDAAVGNMPAYELITLATVCAYNKPKTVFEFGTYDGLTTLHLAMNAADNAKIFTIDLPPDDSIRQTITDDTFYTQGVVVGQHYRGSGEESKIEQIFGDTTKYEHQGLCGKVDLIFVDAGHTYDLVKSDTKKALDMLAPGGIVFWHDYAYTQVGVYTWLNELRQSLPLKCVPGSSLVYYIKAV